MERPLRRILVVDDDEIDRMAVRRLLLKSDMSIEIHEADTCAAALSLLEAEPFDCTFLDYGLPDNNGLYLVKTARALNVQHPLVVLTGQGDERIAVELMKAGATDYLPKSQISAETLPQILRNAIRIARAEQEVRAANERLRENNELLTQQNQDLQAQRERIELQNLQREDFIAHLTHDLRTPLVAANLMFDLFQKEAFGALSPEMHQALASMAQSNQHLLNLVNTLLEVNRYESGTKALSLTRCDMWDIVKSVIDELQPLARYKSLALVAKTDLSAPARLKVMGDCQELRRTISNLVSNSLKFTDTGSVEVSLGYVPGTADEAVAVSGWVSIEVRDTGVGMSAEERGTIFERFQVGKHRQAGSGLGLHLVQRIVNMHSGTIDFTSELGRGSTFTIHLPALAC